MIIKFRKKKNSEKRKKRKIQKKYNKMYHAMCQIQNRNEIPEFLKNNHLNDKMCELGVRDGMNFDMLLTSKPNLLVGIDAWKNDGIPGHNDLFFSGKNLERQYWTAIKRYSNPQICGKTRCLIIRDYTVNACKEFQDYFFNYLYIDADHTYEGISQDMKNFWPKVKVGGVFAGHDYVDNSVYGSVVVFGVIRAVDEFIIKHNIKYFHYLPECHSWMIVKTPESCPIMS